jgi:5-deoxy-glucuronate isomerase
VVNKGEGGLKKASFDLLKLEAGNSFRSDTASNESTLVILSGSCSISGSDFNFENIGSRKDVFSGKPTSVYLPFNTPFDVNAITDVEIGICSAESTLQSKPILITTNDVTEVDLGVLNWTRKAFFIVDQRIDAQHLFVGETLLAPGKWAFPPHRHDYANFPEEVDMEEIYHFRTNPPTGFGIQVHYTDDKNKEDAYLLRNGDTMILAEGYHPVGASPADSLYLLWFMAGEKRIFLSRPDDNYNWVPKCEAMLKAMK